jgi:predicted anti-sigma-YlaC factor YlaD
LETHLETCAECRQLLAEHADDVSDLLATVWAEVQPDMPPAKHRRMSTWAAPAALPWLGMTLLVVAMATIFDLLGRAGPVLSVAAAWAKEMDPAYELVSATPRAGLYLILRRTVSVLVVVIPVLVLAGLPGSVSPALWLLPSLAFSVGTLALGGWIGMRAAAIGLAGVWTVFVVGPGLIQDQMPLVLQPVSLPVWGLIVIIGAVVLAKRADTYARLG